MSESNETAPPANAEAAKPAEAADAAAGPSIVTKLKTHPKVQQALTVAKEHPLGAVVGVAAAVALVEVEFAVGILTGIGATALLAAKSGPEARKQVVVQETEVANLEAQREEKRLDTQVRKPADAASYEKKVQAEAERAARISIAEAEAREVELSAAAQAKKIEQIGNSEAAVTTTRGRAEGEATISNFNGYGASASVTGALAPDMVAGRLFVAARKRDGFYDV